MDIQVRELQGGVNVASGWRVEGAIVVVAIVGLGDIIVRVIW